MIIFVFPLFQTPPTAYRRQVDQVQYNSLPRQSFPMLVTNNSNNGSLSADLDVVASPTQQTPPKQRTVAFGKGISQSNSSYSNPAIHHAGAMEGGSTRKGQAAYSTNNIYHHQLILGQPGALKGYEKQKGYSAPNLGGGSFPYSISLFDLPLSLRPNLIFSSRLCSNNPVREN